MTRLLEGNANWGCVEHQEMSWNFQTHTHTQISYQTHLTNISALLLLLILLELFWLFETKKQTAIFFDFLTLLFDWIPIKKWVSILLFSEKVLLVSQHMHMWDLFLSAPIKAAIINVQHYSISYLPVQAQRLYPTPFLAILLPLPFSSTAGQMSKIFAILLAPEVYQITFRIEGWPHKNFIFPFGSKFWDLDTRLIYFLSETIGNGAI